MKTSIKKAKKNLSWPQLVDNIHIVPIYITVILYSIFTMD